MLRRTRRNAGNPRAVSHISQAKCQGNVRTLDLQQHCTDQLGIHWSAKISSSTPTSESQPEILPQHGLAQEKRSTHKMCRKWSECLQMRASVIWPLPSGRFPNDGEEDHAEIDLVNVCEHLWTRSIQYLHRCRCLWTDWSSKFIVASQRYLQHRGGTWFTGWANEAWLDGRTQSVNY